MEDTTNKKTTFIDGLKWVIENWKNILLIILTIVGIIFITTSSLMKDKLDIAENNVQALKDSIHTYQLENGDLLLSKQNLILEKDELSQYLDISEKERKEIEKKLKSSIAYIAELESSIKIDTLYLHDSVYIENEVTNIKFSYSDDWVLLDGLTKLSKDYKSTTSINNLNIDVPLSIGLTDNNQFFVKSPNPYVTIGNIDGAKVLTKESKPKRFGIGPTFTAGIGYGWGTDFKGGNTNGGLIVGFMIGFSAQYNIWVK